MAPSRIALLATICAATMCCAGMVQVLGINRIVITDGRIAVAASTLPTTSRSGPVDIDFRSETFPLEH